MTMEKLKQLCVLWSAWHGSPSNILLACFKQKRTDQVDVFSRAFFSNGNSSASENSLDSRYFFRKHPCAMYKDAVGNVVARRAETAGLWHN